MDFIYFREGDDKEALQPAKITLANKNAALAELVMFLLIFGYLCAVYGAATYLQSSDFGSKIEA